MLSQNKKSSEVWGQGSAAELLPSILEALGLIPSTADKNIESTNSIPLKKKPKRLSYFWELVVDREIYCSDPSSVSNACRVDDSSFRCRSLQPQE